MDTIERGVGTPACQSMAGPIIVIHGPGVGLFIRARLDMYWWELS